VPRGDIERIAAGIPGARVHVLPRIGHVPMAECPLDLASAIFGFVSG
jgi:pimeloyl-ACP methyl ester carboxylesterase